MEVRQAPQRRFFGRHRDLQRLEACTSPVCLVTGDTGIGKTALLAEGLHRPPGIVAPEPRSVTHEGSIHRTVLASLSGAVALIEPDPDMRSIAKRLVGAAKRATRNRFERLPEIL